MDSFHKLLDLEKNHFEKVAAWSPRFIFNCCNSTPNDVPAESFLHLYRDMVAAWSPRFILNEYISMNFLQRHGLIFVFFKSFTGANSLRTAVLKPAAVSSWYSIACFCFVSLREEGSNKNMMILTRIQLIPCNTLSLSRIRKCMYAWNGVNWSIKNSNKPNLTEDIRASGCTLIPCLNGKGIQVRI